MSLSPRSDLFRFALPKDFIPKQIEEKYTKLLSRNPEVINKPIDYLNESIKTIHIPGISDLYFEQEQHGSNTVQRTDKKESIGLGRINVEPKHTIVSKPADNPLEKIEKEFVINFRMNQGFYNWFMLYETILYRLSKAIDEPEDDVLYIELLDGNGSITGRIVFTDCHINGLDGLDLAYDKTTRDAGDFNITYKFNNINFEFLPYEESL